MDASPAQPTISAPASAEADRFEGIADHLTNLVSVVAPDGTIRRQYGCCQVSGFDPAQRVGRDLFEYVHPEDRSRAREWLQRLAAVPSGRGLEDIELRQQHADGSWLLMRVRGTNLMANPAVGGLLTEEHDETERRRAQLAAEQVRDRLHLAAESMRMGFFEYDVAARRFELSNECYRM